MIQNGLLPHPPEPAIIVMVKKVPLVTSTQRAYFLLYCLSGLLFIASIAIVTFTIQSTTSSADYRLPDSLQRSINAPRTP
jgi:hypothetical protein